MSHDQLRVEIVFISSDDSLTFESSIGFRKITDFT